MLENVEGGRKHEHLLGPTTSLGIETIRIELSALPDTRSEVVGLNFTNVGGNSKALSIDIRG